MQRPPEMRLHSIAKVIQAHVLQRPHVNHTGIVDEHIYSAMLLLHSINGFLHALLVAHIAFPALHMAGPAPN